MSQVFGIGDFLALMAFIIVAFAVFLIVKIAKKWEMEQVNFPRAILSNTS